MYIFAMSAVISSALFDSLVDALALEPIQWPGRVVRFSLQSFTAPHIATICLN